jgi:hypothetical protein
LENQKQHRQQALADSIATSTAAVSAARQRYEDAIDKSRKPAPNANPFDPERSKISVPPTMAAGMKAANDIADNKTAGTFSAAGAAGLALGGISKRSDKLAERTAVATETIAANIKQAIASPEAV